MIDSDTISTIITVIISLLGASGVGAPYLLGLKSKLNLTRRLIVTIDDAFKDGQLTEPELKAIIKMAKKLVEGEAK